jgi:hypothetical protein
MISLDSVFRFYISVYDIIYPALRLLFHPPVSESFMLLFRRSKSCATVQELFSKTICIRNHIKKTICSQVQRSTSAVNFFAFTVIGHLLDKI